MTDYQKAEVKMMKEVVNFFDNNPDLEKTDTILKKHVDLIREKLKDIAKNEIIQNFVNTGYTENKKKAKKEIANLDVNIASSICSYATDTGKNELYNEFKVPISKVQIMSDADIVNYSNTIIVNARKYKKELKPYHVSDEEIANLKNAIDNYSKILLIPAQERKERSVATKNIKKLISESLQILKRSIDQDMINYKDTQSDLYQTYENMREIDDSQTTALSIKGKITDADTKEPLQYVKVTARFKAGSAWADKVKTSTHLGNFQFKALPDGKCTLTFVKNYYQKVVLNSEVHTGKVTLVDVVMKKNE